MKEIHYICIYQKEKSKINYQYKPLCDFRTWESMCFYAPNSVYLQFAAIHSPCSSVVSKQKCDVLIVYETLLCFSIWAGKLNVFFLSQDHAGLFKAGCLCNSPLVAVHLHSFSQYTKVGAKGMTEPKERALMQEKRLKRRCPRIYSRLHF